MLTTQVRPQPLQLIQRCMGLFFISNSHNTSNNDDEMVYSK